MNLNDFLKSAQEKLDKATKGPWNASYDNYSGNIDGPNIYILPTEDRVMFVENEFNDMDFIASAPETIGKLLRMVEVSMEALLHYEQLEEAFDKDQCRTEPAANALRELEKIAEEK